MKAAALSSLRADDGPHKLAQYIAKQITYDLSDLTLSTTIFEMIYLFLNIQSIFLETSIHSTYKSKKKSVTLVCISQTSMDAHT